MLANHNNLGQVRFVEETVSGQVQTCPRFPLHQLGLKRPF
jgi:hypothetical protein